MSDSPGARPETREHAAWRHWVLARAMPAVAHRMNNSQAVVLGLVDLLVRERDDRRVDEIRAEATSHANLIHLISQLSKAHPAGGTSDLRRCSNRAAQLVECVARHAGLELSTGEAPQASLVLSSARTESLFVSVGVTLVHLATPAQRARMRWSFRADGEGALVARWAALGAGTPPWPDVAGSPPDRLFAELRREWSPHGVALRFRGSRRGLACRVRIPASHVGEQPTAERPKRSVILLWMSDPASSELVRTVLEEQGYAVRSVATTDQIAAHPNAALLVVDDSVPTSAEVAAGDLRTVRLPPGPPRPSELFAAIESGLN